MRNLRPMNKDPLENYFFVRFGVHCGLRIFRCLAYGFRFSRKLVTGFRTTLEVLERAAEIKPIRMSWLGFETSFHKTGLTARTPILLETMGKGGTENT